MTITLVVLAVGFRNVCLNCVTRAGTFTGCTCMLNVFHLQALFHTDSIFLLTVVSTEDKIT